LTLRLFFGYDVVITLYEKISILGPGAQYDTCGPRDFGQTTNIPGVYHAKFGSHTCRLFKVLQTNHCQNNCRYCAFRRDRPCLRATSTPDEMASAFNLAHRRRLVDGLFLSSGIIHNPDTTMTAMLDTLAILRQKYHYRGYIHLKIMPGTSNSCIAESFKLANRISLNIESPTENSLSALSPDKNLKNGFFNTLFKIKAQINRQKFYGLKHPSLTTQFVVGAGEESDIDIIRSTHLLYQNFHFSRVFYSAFRPIPQTPLAEKIATPLIRQNRLYQADFLMRFYRFSPSDLFFNPNGILPDNFDPKTIWAQRHPEFFPINLRTADYWTILKVPGLGPTWAKRIIAHRPTLSSLRLPAKSSKYIIY
jgi:predicted DNA-binding helix-hairpin-helix protein